MYKIKRSNGKVPKVLKSMSFDTYDQARQAVRKWVLKMIKKGTLDDRYKDAVNRTVTIGYYGFSVQKD